MNSDDPVQFVSEINQFYARFDVTDFRSVCDFVCDGLVPSPAVISEPEVTTCFLHVNPHKTPGPAGTGGGGGGGGAVCNKKLGPTSAQLFQLLMNLHVVPRSWKTNTIIPVPKETQVRAVNDFRPVALTSVVAKCFERRV